MSSISANTEIVNQAQDAAARQAVCELRADYVCDRPDADIFEDIAWEPSEEDRQWYASLCREHDDRIWAERIAADARRNAADARLADAVFEVVREAGDGSFQALLASLANAFVDHDTNEDVRWVGRKLAGLYDQARLLLDAKSGEQFDERLQCHLDSVACNR